MDEDNLPGRMFLPDIAKRWGKELRETIYFLTYRDVVYTLLENVGVTFQLRDEVAREIEHKFSKLGKETPQEKPETKIFFRTLVIDEYLDVILQKGKWTGAVFVTAFMGQEEAEVFESALITPIEKNQNLLITPNDLYIHYADILRIEKEEGIYPAANNTHSPKTSTDRAINLSLVEILNLIAPELYPEELSSQQKSGITKSINALKNQLPEAFNLCCLLVMEAMPCDRRKEFQTYTRDQVIQRSKDCGVNEPLARDIYKALPAAIKQ